MIGRVRLISKYNLYESKRYFMLKLGEAFERRGVEVFKEDILSIVMPWPTSRGRPPDFECSFNRLNAAFNDEYLWHASTTPWISFLVDPVYYDQAVINTPLSIATCVDRAELKWVKSQGFDNILFMPHAIERELSYDPTAERPYDIVCIGSCYDPHHLQLYWQHMLPPEQGRCIEEAIQLSFSTPYLNFYEATVQVAPKYGIPIGEDVFNKIFYFVDNFMRGWDRVELIRSIRHAKVHVFGGTCWRRERPIFGWNYYLGGQSNVVLHPAITYEESLQVMKQAKICLNSVPSFRDGTHERVFGAYACGALPITSENRYLEEEFVPEEELPFYSFNDRAAMNEKVNEILSDELLRKRMVEAGREKVMAKHTWDQRVEMLIRDLPPLILKRQEAFLELLKNK